MIKEPIKKKSYFIEHDVLQTSGTMALETIGTEGNTLYVNYPELRRGAEDEKSRYATTLKDLLTVFDTTLETKGLDKDGFLPLAKGGKLKFMNLQERKEGQSLMNEFLKLIHLQRQRKKDHLPDDLVYITNKASSRIDHRFNNENVEPPEFMMYDPNTFKKGLVNLTYDGKLEGLTLDDLISQNKDDLKKTFNNQHFLINNKDLFRLTHNLTERKAGSGRFDADLEHPHLERLDYQIEMNGSIGTFSTRNLKQSIIYNLIKSPDTEIIFMTGGSGTGKTVIAYYAALEMLLQSSQKPKGERIEGIKLFKSYDIIGGKDREMGFQPGTAYEKTKLQLESYVDAHNLSGFDGLSFKTLLQDPKEEGEFGKRTQSRFKINESNYCLPINAPAIKIEHLQFARGRTFENNIIIVDEAQNYTPYEMKQLVERVGLGCKIIVLGDPFEQIDNPKLNSNFNGLSYMGSLLLGFEYPRIGMIELDENYRSQVAEISRRFRAPRE